VDVRVLSATNRDLKTEVERGNFRQDLYYRVAVFPIRLPPLRQRREDIPLLAAHFLTSSAERHRKRIEGFAPETSDILTRYDWPGNVRELRNEIERAVALAQDGESIKPNYLTPGLVELGGTQTSIAEVAPAAVVSAGGLSQSTPGVEPIQPPQSGSEPLRKARAAFEMRHITEALQQHQSNVSRTAQALGLSRAALQKKMKAYGLR
jgi:DNA-binding NtrC family response regulator